MITATTPAHRQILAALEVFGLAPSTSLFAQSTPAKPAGDVLTMSKFEVKDVPIDLQILPTVRPFNSVFGTDDNIVDVPRNVTIISQQQLTDIAITDALDFLEAHLERVYDDEFRRAGQCEHPRPVGRLVHQRRARPHHQQRPSG